jgi:hypothetical protein
MIYTIIIFFLTNLLYSNENIHLNSGSISYENNQVKIDTNIITNNTNLESFIMLIKKDSFIIKKDKKYIPKIVNTFFENINQEFSIANPNEDWQVGCIVVEDLPQRKLTFIGLSDNLILLNYFSGGVGKHSNILILYHDNNKIVDLWHGTTLEDIYNLDSLIKTLENREVTKHSYLFF